MAKKKGRELNAEKLFDILSNSDKTRANICAETGWTGSTFREAVQELRDTLGVEDTISVVCEPTGYHETWLYGLRHGNQITDGEASRWLGIRWSYIERSLLTVMHVVDAAVRGMDGRSTKGRKARKLQLHLKRAFEDMQLEDEDAKGAAK